MTDDNKLLREYVKILLSEDQYGGFDITGAHADSPYGANFGSGKDLYNVFVKPFTDVVDTTVGKTKELSQRTQTLGKVAFEALATSLIPTLADDFEQIFANEADQLEKLKAQYKDIYDATWTAFKDNDVAMAAFMFSPSSMITAKVAQQLPIQTVKLLNVLGGGRLDGFLAKLVKKLNLGDTKKPLDRDTGEGLPEGRRFRLAERSNVGELLSQEKIKQVVDSNPKVSQMSDAVQGIINNGLKSVLQRVQGISRAKSVADLEKILGTKLKGSDKLGQLPQQERTALEAVLMKGVKQSAIALYVKGLEKQAKQAIEAGVPENHPYVTLLVNVVSKLKAA